MAGEEAKHREARPEAPPDKLLLPRLPKPKVSFAAQITKTQATVILRQLMKLKTKQVIEVADWNALVTETYGRPYSFQQQDGCKDRGSFNFSVPAPHEDYERDSFPEVVNHAEMGVSFTAWLKRDPKAPLSEDDCGKEEWCIRLWWHRNFYPDVQMIANDLHAKGLLSAGNHTIEIDW